MPLEIWVKRLVNDGSREAGNPIENEGSDGSHHINRGQQRRTGKMSRRLPIIRRAPKGNQRQQLLTLRNRENRNREADPLRHAQSRVPREFRLWRAVPAFAAPFFAPFLADVPVGLFLFAAW